MTPTVSIDGELVAAGDAKISVLDRGLLYGDGCFEVLRSWAGAVPDLNAHLDRLLDTCAALSYRAPARTDLAAQVRATVAAAGPDGDRRVRIVVTRGPGGLDRRLADLGPGHALVICEDLGPGPISVSATIVDWPLAPRPIRGHKLLAYMDHVIARELARAAGADEALRCDAAGRVVEGATSNVFAVIDGTIVTPPVVSGVLPGVTRRHVVALCADLGHAVEERPLARTDLGAAEEWFLTSAVRGITPVHQIGDEVRAIGPVTARIGDRYVARMRGQRESAP